MPPCPTAFWTTETRSHAKRNISVDLTAILVLFAAFLLQIGGAFVVAYIRLFYVHMLNFPMRFPKWCGKREFPILI